VKNTVFRIFVANSFVFYHTWYCVSTESSSGLLRKKFALSKYQSEEVVAATPSACLDVRPGPYDSSGFLYAVFRHLSSPVAQPYL
jgi:hypothetical protein